jgi:integrase/recombinase XerD
MPESDAELIELWLRGRRRDRAADRAAIERFLAYVGKPLARVTVGDVVAFGDALTELSPAPRADVVAAVWGLLRFGRRTGYLPPRGRGRPGPGRPA